MREAFISNEHPIKLWRGRAIIVSGTLSKDMLIAYFPDAPDNTFFVSSNLVTGEQEQEKTSSPTNRMIVLEALQEYESVLFDVWDGSATSEDLSEATEKMIALFLSAKSGKR